MKVYKDIQYSVWNDKFIKLVNLNLVNSRLKAGPYPNGERYVSLPEEYKGDIDSYSMKLIDRTYSWYAYAKKYEFHGLPNFINRDLLKK